MLTLTDDDVLTIVCEGNAIGSGGTREVFRHADYPNIVIKVTRDERTVRDSKNANRREWKNARRVIEQGYPDWVRIPECYLHDEFLVMEYIEGEHPDDCWNSGDDDDCGCDCDIVSWGMHWDAAMEEMGLGDTYKNNVIINDGVLFIIDLAD